MNWDWDKLQNQRKRSGDGFSGPDLEQIGDRLKNMRNFSFPGGKVLLVLLGLVLIAYSSFYIVRPGHVGVVQRFGKYDRTTGEGAHFKFPYPVESVQMPFVQKTQEIEIGFRGGRGQLIEESQMLTGDENIVDVQFTVQYNIKDAEQYLFRIRTPDELVRDAAEAAIREVVGDYTIDKVLVEDRFFVQNETERLLQEIMDSYDSGVNIITVKFQEVHPPAEVVDAFKDVQNAREDRDRFIKEAEAYRNEIIPRTRGEVAAIENQSLAYKESVIRKAQGESARFLTLWEQYAQAKDVTRKRLYLEAMEEVFSHPEVQKIILSSDAMRGLIPYLPLDRLGGTTGEGRTVERRTGGTQ